MASAFLLVCQKNLKLETRNLALNITFVFQGTFIEKRLVINRAADTEMAWIIINEDEAGKHLVMHLRHAATSNCSCNPVCHIQLTQMYFLNTAKPTKTTTCE